MKLLALVILLAGVSCGVDEAPTARDVSFEPYVPDVGVVPEPEPEPEPETEPEPCEVQCSLAISVPGHEDQVALSAAALGACRQLSQDTCLDPGAVLRERLYGVVLQTSSTLPKDEPYRVELRKGAAWMTVSSLDWTYDALREVLFWFVL